MDSLEKYTRGIVSYDEFEAANANMQGKRQSKKDKSSSSKTIRYICPCGLRLRPERQSTSICTVQGRTKSNSPCSKVRMKKNLFRNSL